MDVEKYGIELAMTGDAKIAKQFDATAASGEQSAKRVTAAFAKTAQEIAGSARVAASEYSKKLEQQFNADAARVKEGLAREFLTPADAKRAGQDAARAYNQGVLSQLDALGGAGLNAGNSKTYRELADGLKTVGVEQEKAAVSAGVHGLQLGRLRMEMGTFVGRVTGTNTALDRMAGALGASTLGDPLIIGVLAAIAAIGFAYSKLTEDTRKAAEEQEKLNKTRQDFIDKQGRPAGEFGASQTNLSDTVNSQAREIADKTAQRDALMSQGATERANELNNKIIALTTSYTKNSAELRLMTNEKDRLTRASKLEADLAALEVQHQQALNGAYDKGSVTIARINADYALRASLARDAAQYVGAEQIAMDAAARATRDATVAAAENAAGVGEQRSKIAELNAALPTLQSGFDALAPSMATINVLWQDQDRNVRRLKDAYADIVKDIRAIAAENEKVAKEKVNQAAEQIKKEMKYQQDLQDIWRSSVGKIATDGLKSFQDFFEDVNQLFTRLLARMEAEGKANGIAGKLLGFGAAAVGGAAIGYASQSPGIGAVGGALAGSAYGPYGALIGGLAGLTGGLLGGAQAAKQRRDAEEQLRASLEASARDIQHQMGAITDLAAAIADAEAQRQAALKADLEAYGDFRSKFTGKNDGSVTAALTATNKLYDDYIEWLKKQAEATKKAAEAAKLLANQQSQQNSQLRLLNATGQSDQAFALQQLLEMQKAIADGLDVIAIGMLTQAQAAEKAQREREKQTQILQDQLSAAQQAADALQQVYDSLDQFSKSLNIGQYSPLSPRQQLDAARGQLNTLYQAALGGDQQAGGQFSTVAEQFLSASRKYNASSAGYVLDFNSVSVMADALKSKFGAQLTDAQKQVSLLQQQLDVLKSIDTSLGSWIPVNIPPLNSVAPTLIGGTRVEGGAPSDGQIFAIGSQGIIDRLDTLNSNVAALQTTIRRGNESIVAAVA